MVMAMLLWQMVMAMAMVGMLKKPKQMDKGPILVGLYLVDPDLSEPKIL
jgi:hypothetical protein